MINKEKFFPVQRCALWQQPLVWGIIIIAMTSPLWFSALPPLMDLPGHMARFHVMQELQESLELQRYYTYTWTLLGNLGVDLFVYALRDILTVQQATWLSCLITVVLTTLSIPMLSKSFHGSVQLTAFAALPLVYANFYFWGFLNFSLSIALALNAIALWQHLINRPHLRSAIFLPVSCLIWLCHTIGWGVLGLCSGIILLAHLKSQNQLKDKRAIYAATLQMLPVSLPLLFMVFWRSRSDGGATGFRSGFIQEKLIALFQFLAAQSIVLDLLATIMILLLIFWALRSGKAKFAPGLLWSGLALAVLFIVMPSYIFGSFNADTRLVHIFVLLLLLSIATPGMLTRQQCLIAACLLLALTGARTASITLSWAEKNKRIGKHLSALEIIPNGSRILALRVFNCAPATWVNDFEYNHLADMAIIRRDAFVNTQWHVPGAQPMLPIYNQDTDFGSDPSQYVWDGPCAPRGGNNLTDVLRTFPRNRFDYLWLLRADLRTTSMPDDLRKLYSDHQTALFYIPKPPSIPPKNHQK